MPGDGSNCIVDDAGRRTVAACLAQLLLIRLQGTTMERAEARLFEEAANDIVKLLELNSTDIATTSAHAVFEVDSTDRRPSRPAPPAP